ncbi:hypothetical protein [Actinomycetospora atypica]|uniref:DNA-binding transcriptional regulator of glucitol operon n=1 Tax=Actinomycetospora atypica TaxID=1290095 RepID=A0ABV9YIT5_9PSEU
MGQVLRVLATPRWVGWTVLAVCAVIVCGGMAYWQLIRAESSTGTLLNAGYALQWPLFGVFFAALWWRMLHSEANILAEIRAEDVPDDAAELAPEPAADGPTPFTPRPAGMEPGAGQGRAAKGRAREDYNAMLAELNRREATDTRPDTSTDREIP